MMDVYSQGPCPLRVFDNVGGAFVVGAIGGSIFHSIKGHSNAPLRFNSWKLLGSFTAIKQQTKITAGCCALWGVVFTTLDCSLAHIRKKDDHWNFIISGALTGCIFGTRRGVPAMIVNTIIHGVLFSLIHGGILFHSHWTVQNHPTQAAVFEDPSVLGEKRKS